MLPPDEFLFFSTGAVQILDHSTLRGRIRKFNIRIP
jgi:hypothetical protein